MRLHKSGSIIFDLDGTLIDTLADLAAATNQVLARYGWPPHEQEAYRYLVGEGMVKLAAKAMPEMVRQPELIQEVAAALRQEYQERCLEQSRPYPGVAAMLATLQRHSCRLAVLSNKPQEQASFLLTHFFPDISFQEIWGARAGWPLKPEPTAALALAAALETPPGRCFLVGDSGVDMLTAQQAGMIPVGVLWGFRSAAELERAGALALVAFPAEIVELVWHFQFR